MWRNTLQSTSNNSFYSNVINIHAVWLLIHFEAIRIKQSSWWCQMSLSTALLFIIRLWTFKTSQQVSLHFPLTFNVKVIWRLAAWLMIRLLTPFLSRIWRFVPWFSFNRNSGCRWLRYHFRPHKRLKFIHQHPKRSEVSPVNEIGAHACL